MSILGYVSGSAQQSCNTTVYLLSIVLFSMRRLRFSPLFAIALTSFMSACGDQSQSTLPSTAPAPDEPTWAFTPEPDTYKPECSLGSAFSQ